MRRKISSAAVRLSALVLVFLAVRAALFLGADEAVHTAALAAANSGETVSALLDLGFGSSAPKTEPDTPLASLLSGSALLYSAETGVQQPSPTPSIIPEEEAPSAPAPDTVKISPTPDVSVVETTITGKSGYDGADGIYLKNETDYEIDIAGLLSEPLGFTIDPSQPQVLIIHTHGSESFEQSDGLSYAESDPWRTEDRGHNVIRLGDELEKKLTERGIAVLHDRELYDYPSYAGSYSRAEEAIRGYLDEYPDIKVVLDLHRDALMSDDGTVYKTIAEVGGEKCAQVMIIAGSNFSGLDHPEWRENLKLGLNLQASMNEKYPTLARPLKISRYRYNQQLTTGSLIIEIGCNGNTLTEALAATGYFADAAADVLLNTSE